MAYIAESFIAELLNRIDVVDVINARVQLKQKGHEFSACCPFHKEKTASFTVSPNKQFYHCFGCGVHGNAIGFMMSYDNLSYVEAIETLASQAGLNIVYDQNSVALKQKNKPQLEPVFEVLQSANVWFQQQLKTHPNKSLAVDYLKQRQLTGQICHQYQIGFAPNYGLLAAIGVDEKSQQALLDAGLINRDDNGNLYERFRERIQFPIFNFKNQVIGFGGRTLVDHKAKYYNSPTTEVFHKGKELYGLNQARANIKQQGIALIVEGYMDVVALAQFGVNYVVATLGTAATHDHLKNLFRTTNKIVCCFDGDNAGVKAAVKAMREVLPLMRAGRSFSFVFLPQGEDPDSYIRNYSKAKFEMLISRAKSLDVFIFKYLQQGLDLQQISDRAQLVKKATELLQQLPKGTYFELMLEKLSQLAQFSEQKIMKDIELVPQISSHSTIVPKAIINTDYKSGVKAITLLAKYPELAAKLIIKPILAESKHPVIKMLLQLITIINNEPNIKPNLLFHKIHNIEGLLALIQSKQYEINAIKAESPKAQQAVILIELNESIANTEQQVINNKNLLTVKSLSSGEDIKQYHIKKRNQLN